MARTLIWNIARSALMLALAVFVVEESASNFQAVVFLVAIIGYQRLSSEMAEDRQAHRIRYLRTEAWFHRLDSAISGVQPGTAAASSIVAKIRNHGELEDLEQAVKQFTKERSVEGWIVGATELLLLLAAASVLMR
jgi:hypothetical protein